MRSRFWSWGSVLVVVLVGLGVGCGDDPAEGGGGEQDAATDHEVTEDAPDHQGDGDAPDQDDDGDAVSEPDSPNDTDDGSCRPDRLEPNDTLEAASPIRVDRYEGLVLCPDDVDVFVVERAAGSGLRLRWALLGDDAVGPRIEWGVVGSPDAVEVTRLDPARPIVEIPAESEPAQLWVLMRPVTTFSLPYALEVERITSSAPVECDVPDAQEPNDSRETAPPIESGVYPDLTVCGTGHTPVDWDVWRVVLNAGDTLHVELDYERGARSQLQLALYDPIQDAIVALDFLRYTATRSGTYFLGVDAIRGTSARYTLTVEIERGAGPPECVDALEENDTVETAASCCVIQELSTATVCPGDDDWYAFDASLDELLAIHAYTALFNGDLIVELIAPDGVTVMADSVGQSDEQDDVYATARQSGTHYVHVFMPEGQTTVYALSTVKTADVACSQDPNEPNDDPETDPIPTLGADVQGFLCVGDVDWFAVDNDTDGERVLRVSADPGSNGFWGQLQLTTTDRQASIAPRSMRPGAEWTWSVPVGRSWLRIDNTVPFNSSYTLHSVWPEPSPCEDAFEPNDAPFVFHPLTPGSWSDLGLCIGDDVQYPWDDGDGTDFYDIQLEAGQTLTVSLDFVHAAGDIDLYILPALAEFPDRALARSNSTDDDELVSYTAPASATYRIMVTLLQLCCTGSGPCCPARNSVAPYAMTVEVQ